MRQWLRSLFAPKAVSRTRTPGRIRLATEELERREVLSSYFDWSTGQISVFGTEGADRIVVTQRGGWSPLGYVPGDIQVTVNGRVELTVMTQFVRGLSIDALGGDDPEVSNRTAIGSTLNGGWGSDTVIGGTGKDTIFGWVGNDWLDGREGEDNIVGGSGNDVLHGGWGNATDLLWGRNGGPAHDNGVLAPGEQDNDTLYGLDGRDYLNGNVGDDLLYGFTGIDTLVGGPGDDRLYGEEDDDYLFGEGGEDGLFGGFGVNYLYGGEEADRFLTWTGGISYIMDQNVGGYDAVLQFRDNLTASFGGTFYGSKAWTYQEIQAVDGALAILHREGRGAQLLRAPNTTGVMVFDRHSGWLRGFHDGATVHLSDMQLNQGDNYLVGYTLHEIAHYWNSGGMGASNQRDFRAESGWTDTDPKSTAYTKITTEWDKAVWWYRTTSGFASGYAKSGPDEDFAESFAAYFLNRAGRSWYTSDNLGGAGAIPGKLAVIKRWVDSL